jgi:exodeoxyribonuclease-3
MDTTNKETKAVQLYSLNARGLRDKHKRSQILHFLKNKGEAIILLQETHTVPTDITTWKREWNGDIFLSHGTNFARGVAILIPESYEAKISRVEVDEKWKIYLVGRNFQRP